MIEQRVLVMEPITPAPVGALVDVSTPAVQPLDTGDLIHVVYWRPIPMPGNPKNGEWDVLTATVIQAGAKRVCCELHVVSMPHWCGSDWEAVPGSMLRFVQPERAFRTDAEAKNAAKQLKPPS